VADDASGGDAWEAQVLERLRAGHASALEALYDRYAPLVYGLARRVCASTALAEDVTQEVFAHVWSHADRIDMRRGSLRAYLGMVTHRRAVDVVRSEESRRARESRDAARAPVHPPDLADATVALAQAASVRSALDALPPEQREVVTLTYLEGNSYRDVATHLGIPEGTAKSRGRLALQKLEATLLHQGVSWA
jgi:RNA polymerase sigma-70 factor (ECF subfamily)